MLRFGAGLSSPSWMGRGRMAGRSAYGRESFGCECRKVPMKVAFCRHISQCLISDRCRPSASCRERFQRAYGDGLERQYAAYQKLNRGVSSPINFSHISLVSGLPFSSYPLTDFSTDITHPMRKTHAGDLIPNDYPQNTPCVSRSLWL